MQMMQNPEQQLNYNQNHSIMHNMPMFSFNNVYDNFGNPSKA